MFYLAGGINNSTPKRKRHSPDPSKLDFDKEAMLTEVNCLADGSSVRI